MSQTYTIDCFVSTHGGQSDLAIMESNFESLRSTFSGTGTPANSVAGMLWFDTTQKLLKVKNAANGAWLGVLTGTGSLKMLVYRNTAEDGWAIDSGVTDRVVAIKGGATYTAGAAVAGSWTITHAFTHNHQWYKDVPGSGADRTYDVDGAEIDIPSEGSESTGGHRIDTFGGTQEIGAACYTTNSADSTNDATWRPAAAVVTIQYPDI